MSVITLQLGQCGNQIGHGLFELLYNDSHTPPKYTSIENSENVSYKVDTLDKHFTEQKDGKYEAKAVLVDMEPKVVSKLIKSSKTGKWNYNSSSFYIQKKGSGNNWALGYYGYGKTASEHVIELCRREAEKCDWFTGLLVLMSLAGGTGSGLGSYVTRALRDAFPEAVCVNHVVWPYLSGEVVVQNYNTVLTISHLQESTDLVIGQRNDHLHAICSKLLRIQHISFEQINRVIAHKLAGVLQPAFTEDYQSVNSLHDLVLAMASHPSYKFAAVKSIPHISDESMAFSTFVWPALMKHMRQMLIADAAMEEGVNWEIKAPCVSTTLSTSDMKQTKGTSVEQKHSFNKSVANLLILRGQDQCDIDSSGFREVPLYSTKIPYPSCYTEWRQTRSFNQYPKSATLVTNSQTFIRPMNNNIEKAWKMFNSRAYLHQYEKYGLTDDDFIDSFGTAEQVVADYTTI